MIYVVNFLTLTSAVWLVVYMVAVVTKGSDREVITGAHLGAFFAVLWLVAWALS